MVITLLCSGLDEGDLGGTSLPRSEKAWFQGPWQSGLGVIIASIEGWPSQRNSQPFLGLLLDSPSILSVASECSCQNLEGMCGEPFTQLPAIHVEL